MRTSTWFYTVFYFKKEVLHLPAGSRAKLGSLLSIVPQIKQNASQAGQAQVDYPKRNKPLRFQPGGICSPPRSQPGLASPRPRRTARLLYARKPGTLSQPTTWKPLTLEEENQRTSGAPSSNRRGGRWDPPPRGAPQARRRAQGMPGNVAKRAEGRRAEVTSDYISHRYRRQR